MNNRWIAAVAVVTMLVAAAWAQEEPVLYDPDYNPTVDNPAFEPNSGPLILVDEAHNNYHTIEGRYHVFAELMQNDGYRVQANTESFSAASLAGADILVIANALNAANITDDENWATPILPALTGDEIQAVKAFVEGGGALLLVCDHMPFPGAAADLAAQFGVIWQNAFAFAGNFTFGMAGPDPNLIRFRLGTPDASGGIAHAHPVFQGRNDGEAIDYVSTFTGSAFRLAPGADVQPVMELGAGPSSLVAYPMASQEISQATPMASALGLLQGATMEYGDGRVAFMGEASMFSARKADFIEPGFDMGMSNQELAPHNKQFTLNLAHWLSGMLPADRDMGAHAGLTRSGAPAGKAATTPFELAQNAPNPFNPDTQISYTVPEAASVRIDIFNALGQRVRTLVQAEHAPGTYAATWDGTNDAGQQLTGGVYLYQMKAGAFTDSGKMMLVE